MEEGMLKKVLIVTHGFPPSELGGTELYSYNLAKSLSKKEIEVSVFTRLTRPLPRRGIHNERYVFESSEGLRIFRAINSSNNIIEFLNPYISQTFRNVILKERPDIIHFQHLVFLSADLPEIAVSHNIPSIMTFHDYWFLCPRVQLLDKEGTICEGPGDCINCALCFETPFLNHRFLSRFGKFVPSRLNEIIRKVKQNIDNRGTTYTTKIIEFQFRLNFLRRQFNLLQYKISPSHYLIKRHEREGLNGFYYLPHGLPPVPRVDLKPSKSMRIGYMGNINYPKGLAIVINELYELLQEGRVKLVIYGQPYDLQYYRNIRKRIKRLPSDSVDFCGRYKNTFESLWKIFSSFDILVFPSVWEENSPIVIREALLAGRPIIACNLGGVPEIVRDDVNGLLFNPFKGGNLQDKVKRLLKESNLLERLAKGARDTEIDTIEEHTDKLIHLYKGILANSKKTLVKNE